MRRREFISLLGGAAVTSPLPAGAQQSGRVRRIGVLLGNAEHDPQVVAGLAAFKTALQELGWIDGHNIQIDYRFAAADVDRMNAFAKEMRFMMGSPGCSHPITALFEVCKHQ